MVEKNVSDDFLFPLPIPLPELFQMMIQRFCIPTFILLESLTEKPAPEASDLAPEASDLAPDAVDHAPDADDFAPEASDHTPEPSDLVPDASDLAPDASDLFPDPSNLAREASDLSREAGDLAREAIDLDLDKKIDKFDLDGNKAFKESFFEEVLDAYSSTINLAQDCNKPFDPLLLTKRSMVYIKLEEWENALKDANDYITRRPYCWRGYALKALALDGLNKEVSADLNDKASAEVAAALAFYHNRGIFTDFPIFVESFPDLQSRTFICDSADELLDAMSSHEVETGMFKILVLGSEEYILYSETVEKPWNNCILVGTRKNCSVSLTSNYDIFLLKCMLTNLSFRFNECRLHCLPDSFVKILSCDFTSYDDKQTIKTEGVFNAKQCSFTRSPLVCSKQSRADVDDCSFCNNAKDGLRVEKGGTLKVENCCIYNNGGYGLFVDKSKCVVVNCDIHDNGHDGISLYGSENVTLVRNNVYNNNMSGICMERSLCHVRENNLLDNGTWGIWVDLFVQCNISMNKIFRNKTGGVRMHLEAEGKRFSPSVVELNKICHNGGPGLLVDDEIIKVAETLHLNSPNSFQSVKFQNNEVYENKENENDSKLNLSVPYCSYCRVKCKPTMCKKCFTTAYCSESCQKQHYSKHKEICKVLREKSSYLITSTEKACAYEIKRVEGTKEVGSKFSAPPPRDGRRFDVKVHTAVRELGSYAVILHDRSLDHCVKFASKVVDKLLKEFGVLCEGNVHEKKLFFHCLFENNGQLRLFTNEFAEFQNW
jgi:chitinase